MIYLDHNATTFMHNDVKSLMLELANKPLNPSSIHSFGRNAKGVIEKARNQIASALGIRNTKDYQVVFTSSGTEANNLIISNFKKGKILVSEIEHLSILDHQQYMPNIELIKVDNNGVVNLGHLEKMLHQTTSSSQVQGEDVPILVSVMIANNETGVIQPLKEITSIAKKFGALVHSDCVQGFGKMHINLEELGIDFITISGHKFGGAIGAGALIAKAHHQIKPMIVGGGQERGIRAGTENVHAIAGLGLASEKMVQELDLRIQKMRKLQLKLEQAIKVNFSNIKIVASDYERLPNTSLLIIPSNTDRLVIAFDLEDIAVSSGSACSSGKVSTSHVLQAMNFPEENLRSAIRVSTGCDQREEDVDSFIKALKIIVK